jgi:hypothetical protein
MNMLYESILEKSIMRHRIAHTCALFAILTIPTFAQLAETDSTAAVAPVLGIWRCQMEGLPAVTLTVTDEGGSLTGGVLFYLHRREPGQPVTATPGVPEPLFHPRFDGKTLTFEVSHRRAHPPGSLNDAPITFELKLDGPDKAQLINENEKTDPNAPAYFLVRSTY